MARTDRKLCLRHKIITMNSSTDPLSGSCSVASDYDWKSVDIPWNKKKVSNHIVDMAYLYLESESE